MNIRRLASWSIQDLPILVFATLALISYLSTPDLPNIQDLDTQLIELLDKIPDEKCRQKIREFYREPHKSIRTEVVEVPNDVKRLCHQSSDLSQQGVSDAWRADSSYKENFDLHWIAHNMTLHNARLPSLAYLIMVGTTDSFSALEILIDHIYALDHSFVIHVDEKSEQSVHLGVSRIAKSRDNIFIMDSERVTWGGYSVVETQVPAGTSFFERRGTAI
jgi:hypothetical protein